jgi:hypothetical protein
MFNRFLVPNRLAPGYLCCQRSPDPEISIKLRNSLRTHGVYRPRPWRVKGFRVAKCIWTTLRTQKYFTHMVDPSGTLNKKKLHVSLASLRGRFLTAVPAADTPTCRLDLFPIHNELIWQLLRPWDEQRVGTLGVWKKYNSVIPLAIPNIRHQALA